MTVGIPTSGNAWLKSAAHIPVKARFAATDRSIERVRSTGIWARARRIRIEVSSSRLFRLVTVKK
jgi:hypothetical protein